MHRRIFIRTCTNRLFLSDIKKRGFAVSDVTCIKCKKIKLDNPKIDNIQHFVADHLNHPYNKFSMKKLMDLNKNIATGEYKYEDISVLINNLSLNDVDLNPSKSKKVGIG